MSPRRHVGRVLPPTGVVRVGGVRTVLEVEPKLGVAGTRLHVGRRVATEPARVVVVGEMECVPERTRRRATRLWKTETKRYFAQKYYKGHHGKGVGDVNKTG